MGRWPRQPPAGARGVGRHKWVLVEGQHRPAVGPVAAQQCAEAASTPGEGRGDEAAQVGAGRCGL